MRPRKFVIGLGDCFSICGTQPISYGQDNGADGQDGTDPKKRETRVAQSDKCLARKTVLCTTQEMVKHPARRKKWNPRN